MSESVIAIVCDFDETLGPDTISFLLEQQNISPSQFWQEVNKMVQERWDPPLAYMHKMLQLSYEGKLDLSQKTLQKFGKKLKLFPGLPQALLELEEFVHSQELLKKTGLILEEYIISGGLEEMIRATKLEPFMEGIFGCNFNYRDATSQPTGIKSAISFTEKTRFIHGIRKGISTDDLRTEPYRVNDAIDEREQRIPWTQMVYIGDGPSDIPCLAAITRKGGAGMGVSAPYGSFKKSYELARGKRITVGPYTANYRKGSDMRKVLEETILRIGLAIDVESKRHVIRAPGFS